MCIMVGAPPVVLCKELNIVGLPHFGSLTLWKFNLWGCHNFVLWFYGDSASWGCHNLILWFYDLWERHTGNWLKVLLLLLHDGIANNVILLLTKWVIHSDFVVSNVRKDSRVTMCRGATYLKLRLTRNKSADVSCWNGASKRERSNWELF